MSDTEELEHSEMGPSTAHRWRPCPGSVEESRGLPDTAGIEAAFGTVFHDRAALCLQFGLEPQGMVGTTMEVEGHGEIEFDQEMADNMLAGLDYARVLMEDATLVIVEEKVSLENWVGPGEFGTTDLAIVDIERWRIITFDWKYGAGVPVSPERNDQALLYTLGVWDRVRDMFYDAVIAGDSSGATEAGAPWAEDIEVWIVIEQPRAPGGGGVWKTTMGEVLRIGEEIKRDAERARKPGQPRVPGEKQCKFCKAARFNTCKARIEWMTEALGADFDDLEDDFDVGAETRLVAARALSPKQRSQLILMSGMIRSLLTELHEEAYKDALAGRPTPGLILSDGRAPARKWRDESKAAVVMKRFLGKEAYREVLLSPSQVQDLVGKKHYDAHYASFVDVGESKPQLVPDDGTRTALPSLMDDFDDDDMV